MRTSIKSLGKLAALFLTGGLIYYLIEILYRGYSHYTMFILGGFCFICCGLINELFRWDTPLALQQLICAGIITVLEFIFGVVLNIWLGLGIWDYSSLPFNILGQICLPYSLLWFFLSLAAIILDDYMRYWFFGEEKPRYVIALRYTRKE